MTSPLTRPPLGGPIAVEESDQAERGRSKQSAIVRVVEELQSLANRLEPRRLAWGLTALIPPFALTRTRARLLSMVGCDVRGGTAVSGFVEIVGPPGCASRLRVGPGCILGPGVTFNLDATITIGKNVSIGPRAILYTATHELGGAARRMQFNTLARPIVIEDGAWIGLGAMILPGVRIGPGAVVAAGAVVSKDVPPNTLVGGNPATVLQELPANR